MNFTLNMLYIDPAATSMLLSSITAIVVACGAGIFMAYRAMKKKVKKAFHIDENANKEVEEDLVIHDEQTAEENAADSTATENSQTVVDNDVPTDTTKTTKKTTAKKSTTKTTSTKSAK